MKCKYYYFEATEDRIPIAKFKSENEAIELAKNLESELYIEKWHDNICQDKVLLYDPYIIFDNESKVIHLDDNFLDDEKPINKWEYMGKVCGGININTRDYNGF